MNFSFTAPKKRVGEWLADEGMKKLDRELERLRNRSRWQLNELSHKLKGDTRCEFQKYVDRCRFLKLPNIISNPGRCSNPAHQH